MALSIFTVMAVAGPCLLATMGGIVSMIPNIARRHERFYWLAGFMIAGVLTAVAAYVEGNQLQKQVTGAEVMSLTVLGDVDPSGNFILASLNGNDVPVYDVFVTIRPNADAPIRSEEEARAALRSYQVELGTIPVGLKRLPFALAPGYYQITIHTRDQIYTEMLRFAPLERGIGQSYVVADFYGHTFAKVTSPETFAKVY